MFLWQRNYLEGHLLLETSCFPVRDFPKDFTHHNWKRNQNNLLNWPQPRCQPSQATERGALHVALPWCRSQRWEGPACERDNFRWLPGCWPALACSVSAGLLLPRLAGSTIFSPRSLKQVLPWYREPPRSTTWIPLVLHRCWCRML